MKTSDGAYHQCFNGQAIVDATAQVIVAAELSDQAPEARLLEPALEQLAENLDAIEAELPDDAALCADAGYFSEENVRITAQHGLDAHIATGRFKHSEPPSPAPRGPIAKNATPKQRMARKLRTNNGRATYARRKVIAEPVFGQMETVQDARRLLLRGKPAARAQWRFHCAIHNLLKLHRAGGLGLIRERNSAPPSPSAGKRRPLATLATVMHSLAARFRRSLATMSTDRLPPIAPIPVTDPGS
jgi:Transposase DDE domain